MDDIEGQDAGAPAYRADAAGHGPAGALHAALRGPSRARMLRRVLAASLAVSLAAGASAFLATRLRAERYRATATVRLSTLGPRPAVGQGAGAEAARQDLIDLTGIARIGFDSYRALAFAPASLRAALAAVPTVPSAPTASALARAASLTRLSSGGDGGPLVVAHTVTDRDPAVAATLANAWARATAAAVRRTVATDTAHLSESVSGQLVSASDAVNAAQTRWTAFQRGDDREHVRAQLSGLEGRITAAQDRLDVLERRIAASQARQTMLRAIVQARTHGEPSSLTAQVAALASAGAIASTLATDLTRALADVPGGMAQSPQDAATVVARTQLQSRAGDLAADVAERSTVGKQLAGLQKLRSDLQAQLADEQRTAEELRRRLDAATRTYQQLARVSPLLQAANALAPEMASVLSAAAPPQRPVARRSGLVTLAASGTAFLLMLVGTLARAGLLGAARARGPRSVRGLRSAATRG